MLLHAISAVRPSRNITGVPRHLDIQERDRAFGGRWNAGSNKSGGRTPMAPRDYAAALRDRLLPYCAGRRHAE